MHLITELDKIISKWHLLTHQFYKAWSAGELSIDILKRYAAQYYHQVQSFPRFVSRVHTHCPHIDARKVLLENLVDEEIHGTDHPALWMQFAEGLGASKEMVNHETALPETQDMVDVYYNLADEDWTQGLCALYAYESQVPAVSASKIEGLIKFYGITDPKTLEFFTAHQVYDERHAQQVATLINKYAHPDQAIAATEKSAKSLFKFLDGMCRVGGISCLN